MLAASHMARTDTGERKPQQNHPPPKKGCENVKVLCKVFLLFPKRSSENFVDDTADEQSVKMYMQNNQLIHSTAVLHDRGIVVNTTSH